MSVLEEAPPSMLTAEANEPAAEGKRFSLQMLIRQKIDDGVEDEEEAAQEALNELDEETLRAFAFPIGVRIARSILRSRVRQVEHQVSTVIEEKRLTLPEAMRALINQKFRMPGQDEDVRWGEATIAQHCDRAKWLRTLAGQTVRTAELHESAVDSLREAGVSTLDELAAVSKKRKAKAA